MQADADRSDGTAAASSSGGGPPACYLISYNQQSKHNIGEQRILRRYGMEQGSAAWTPSFLLPTLLQAPLHAALQPSMSSRFVGAAGF